MIYDIILNLEKTGIKPRIKVSQYDKTLPEIRATLYSNNQPFNVPSGSTVYICGTKKDNTGFKYACSYSTNTVTATITEQMTAFSGDVEVEFTIESSGSRKGTENFILEVEPTALADDVIISETDIPAIQRLSQPASATQYGVVKIDNDTITVNENGQIQSSASVDIQQTTGQSTTAVMSQKATTDALGNKADLVNGRIPYSQLPESAMEYKGTWNADTNTPTLANGTGDTGDFYVVSVAGTSLGQTFNVNDRVIYDGSLWQKLSGGEVMSVNNKTGAVVLDTDDISDTNKTHKFVTESEKTTWSGKANVSDIPTDLSQLNDDSTHRVVTDTERQTWNGKSVVSFSQTQTSGTEVGEITINNTTTKLFAPTGGGGGGDMYAATYDANGDVANAGGIPAYVSNQITTAITNAIGGSY